MSTTYGEPRTGGRAACPSDQECLLGPAPARSSYFPWNANPRCLWSRLCHDSLCAVRCMELNERPRTVPARLPPCSRNLDVALRPIDEARCGAGPSRDGSRLSRLCEERNRPASTSRPRPHDHHASHPARRFGRPAVRSFAAPATRHRAEDRRGNTPSLRERGLCTAQVDDVLLPVLAAQDRRSYGASTVAGFHLGVAPAPGEVPCQ